MKSFLIKLSVFFILLIILAYSTDCFLSYHLKKEHSYNGEIEVWNDIYAGKINADIAIYGSSRAWVQFNPLILEDSLAQSVYNFGLDGHNFLLQYLRHIEYFKYNRHPEQIIISVDLSTFQQRKDLYLFEQFLPFMLWNKDIQQYTASYTGFHKIDYYLPLFRFSGKYKALFAAIKNTFASDTTKYRHKGYAGQIATWNTDLDNAMKVQTYYDIQIDSANVALFEKFITECIQINIRPILVCSPEYIAGQKFIRNRDVVTNICKQIAEKNNLLFLDYSNDTISTNKSLFYNSLHFNSTGADIFTKKLATDLKKIESDNQSEIGQIKKIY